MALALGASLAEPAAAPLEMPLRSGVTSLRFQPEILADLGLEQADVAPTAAALREGAQGFALAVPPSAAAIDARGDDFEGFASADLRHAGGFALRRGDARIELGKFRLAETAPPYALELRDAQGARWLWVDRPHALLGQGLLSLANADLLIAPELAAWLGRPDLAGTYVGVLDAELAFGPEAGGASSAAAVAGGCVGDFSQPVDLWMQELTGLTQAVREPGGRVAVAPAATVHNLGPGDVQWLRAIAPDSPVGPHPFLALHVYRLSGGVLEQIGRSDLKHTFFATNTGCPCEGGQILYAGCEDLYGVFTNLDRSHLAPRGEIDPFAVSWTSLGSHFDGVPADDFRSHGGDGAHDAFAHRLVVREPQLQTPGARYFYDGWYMAPNDSDLLNSMGHREVDPTFSSSTWTFPAVDAGTANGSILDVFVDPQDVGPGEATELYDSGEGRVQLAVVTSDLGGGVHHYEYALMNFDFRRTLRSVSLPLDPGQTVSNPGFGDADTDPGNDWTVSVTPQAVTWTAPPGNPLAWGTLYNFRMDVDAEPVELYATLTPLTPGTPALLRVRTLPEPGAGASAAAGATLLALLARRRRQETVPGLARRGVAPRGGHCSTPLGCASLRASLAASAPGSSRGGPTPSAARCPGSAGAGAC
jgi:hypothetical protein